MEKDEGHSRLLREMGIGSAIILVVANMLGTGIFTTSGFIMGALGDPTAMILCWFIGGILALSGALSYGELGGMFPHSGGEYVYLRESFGGLVGFLSGWISLIVGFSAPIAAAAVAFAAYLFKSLPVDFPVGPTEPFFELGAISLTPVTFTAVAVIVALSLVHIHSLAFGSRVQNFLTGFKVAVILSLIAAGFFFGKGSLEHFSGRFDLGIVFSGEFATSLIFISFAYSGWNAAAYLGAEIKEPGKNIPRALFWGTLAVMVMYLLLNAVFVYALPAIEMKGILEIGAKSAAHLFGQGAGNLFSLAITICLLSVISAMIMAGPRVYYAMARDGNFITWFGKITEGHRTPGPSIFLQAVIAIVMVVTSSFDTLLIYIGFTLAIFAMLTVAGMLLLRLKRPRVKRPYRTFGYPVTPIVFILSNLWIIVFSIKTNPVVTLCGGATISVGILAYLIFTWASGDFKEDARTSSGDGDNDKTLKT